MNDKIKNFLQAASAFGLLAFVGLTIGEHIVHHCNAAHPKFAFILQA